jgi:hypothetical protein
LSCSARHKPTHTVVLLLQIICSLSYLILLCHCELAVASLGSKTPNKKIGCITLYWYQSSCQHPNCWLSTSHHTELVWKKD